MKLPLILWLTPNGVITVDCRRLFQEGSSVRHRLLTRERVERLGFVEWDSVEVLVEKVFKYKDISAMRFAFIVAQWSSLEGGLWLRELKRLLRCRLATYVNDIRGPS